jgi:hypothetical protein
LKSTNPKLGAIITLVAATSIATLSCSDDGNTEVGSDAGSDAAVATATHTGAASATHSAAAGTTAYTASATPDGGPAASTTAPVASTVPDGGSPEPTASATEDIPTATSSAPALSSAPDNTIVIPPLDMDAGDAGGDAEADGGSVEPPDDGGAMGDSSAPETDGGSVPEMDGGSVPEMDGGSVPEMDGGSVYPMPDSGIVYPMPDGGSMPFDSGVPMTDGGVSNPDSAVAPVPSYDITFTSLGATSNGYGAAGDYGSSSYPAATLYFIGITPIGSGYFEVYDTGGSPAAGVSGSNPAGQASFAVTSFGTQFEMVSFDVYNPGGSAVSLDVGGWSGVFTWNDPVGDVANATHLAAPGWSTITLAGFMGIASLTIDFADNTELYFNTFVVQ